MNFHPPFGDRIFHIFKIVCLVLLLSCQSDPIVLNSSGGYDYLNQSFQLNATSSETIQGESHTGTSSRLYSGILNSGDTVSTFIRLLPQILDTHQVCSADSIFDIKIVLTSTTPIALLDDTTIIETLFQLDFLKIFLISSEDIDVIEEDAVITSEILSWIMGSIPEILSYSLKTKNSFEINLFDQDNEIIDRWCDNKEKPGILVSYSPTDSTYLEFYSSDGINVESGPNLSLAYSITEGVPIKYNRYFLNNADWSGGSLDDNDNGPYYFEKRLYDSLDVIHIYAFNLKENSSYPHPEMQFYDSLLFQDDILTSENLNMNITLLKVNLILNDNIENLDSIIFSLSNVFAFRSEIDPEGDNWFDENDNEEWDEGEGTEGNNTYDRIDGDNDGEWDEGEEREKWFDYGDLDNCPDSLETGDGLCGATISIYYPTGTENNGVLDWNDLDGSGTWDEGEGEKWEDVGIDGCSDIYEAGEDSCYAVPNPDWEIGEDPNKDNYNIDPSGDDWNVVENPNGTEENEIWNEGEPYQDWGSDGLPASMMNGVPDANNSEGNGNYEIGEPFFDTGEDGLFNSEETGYNEDGTENNEEFDQEGEFNDCGEDNCCDSDENCNEPVNDNFNIDPNNDNYATDTTFTQGNNILDWTDYDNDGLWDDGEGEQWFDWGLDQVPDSLEAFQGSNLISPNLYGNDYVFNIAEGLVQESPELVDSTMSLWISKIEKTNNDELTIEIAIQSKVALKGLQFQLFHAPYTRVDSISQTHETSIAQIGTEKLFEDLSILPKTIYTKGELEEKLLIDYANDVAAFLDFDSLDIFLSNGENIISNEYSNLILYVDSIRTNIYNDMNIYVVQENSTGLDVFLSSKVNVLSSSDSIIIPMGYILKAFQSGNLENYDRLKLIASSSLYNYSILSIRDNARLDVMYTK